MGWGRRVVAAVVAARAAASPPPQPNTSICAGGVPCGPGHETCGPPHTPASLIHIQDPTCEMNDPNAPFFDRWGLRRRRKSAPPDGGGCDARVAALEAENAALRRWLAGAAPMSAFGMVTLKSI